ncbi:hypothetical protein AA0616_1378 [Komagataeibacter nataicola NRIC 0616]|nr:hypothetical protein AA0616_1378 [Komagataeibacter nataicola NRIC 0616]
MAGLERQVIIQRAGNLAELPVHRPDDTAGVQQHGGIGGRKREVLGCGMGRARKGGEAEATQRHGKQAEVTRAARGRA